MGGHIVTATIHTTLHLEEEDGQPVDLSTIVKLSMPAMDDDTN